MQSTANLSALCCTTACTQPLSVIHWFPPVGFPVKHEHARAISRSDINHVAEIRDDAGVALVLLLGLAECVRRAPWGRRVAQRLPLLAAHGPARVTSAPFPPSEKDVVRSNSILRASFYLLMRAHAARVIAACDVQSYDVASIDPFEHEERQSNPSLRTQWIMLHLSRGKRGMSCEPTSERPYVWPPLSRARHMDA